MKKKGFTLLELIVVLFIMSIIIGIASVRFNIINKIKAKNEIQTLINDVDYAKVKAMTVGEITRITFYKNKYIVKISDIRYDDEIVRNLDFLTFENFSTSNHKNVIKFNPSGSVTYPGKVKLSIDDKSGNIYKYDLVVIVSGGHSRIEGE